MLVLKRKPGQEIFLDGEIRVVQLGGGRIAIDAPKDVRIVRGELIRDANGITAQALDELYLDTGNPVG